MTIEERNAADQDFITREALRIRNEKKKKKVEPDKDDQKKKKEEKQ